MLLIKKIIQIKNKKEKETGDNGKGRSRSKIFYDPSMICYSFACVKAPLSLA